MIGIATVMSIIRRLVKYQDLINNDKIENTKDVIGNKHDTDEIIELKKELELKTLDVETLQKQVKNAETYFDEKNKSETSTTGAKKE